MSTKITAAAQRIAEHVNSTPSTVRHAYDTEGNPVHGWEAGMGFSSIDEWEAFLPKASYRIKMTGTRGTGRPVYVQVVQDHLDAADAADARVAETGDAADWDSAYQDHLADAEFDRQVRYIRRRG